MRSTATASASCAPAEPIGVSLQRGVTARMADYLELTKPRISLFVLVTVACGFLLGGAGHFNFIGMCHAIFGIAWVAAGAGAINQFLERFSDAQMPRTADRPLPAGRLTPMEVLWFGIAAGVGGCLYLLVLVNWLTAALAAITYLLYTLVYTPLKSVTPLNTAIGAIPGALPPVLGWTAAGGRLEMGAFCLFALMFLWQFPHFMAIAWLYQDQYRRAGLKMISTVNNHSKVIGLVAVGYALALLPVSLLPSQLGLAAGVYFWIATVLGLGYLLSAIQFLRRESSTSAHLLLLVSLIYLPVVLLSMVWEHWHLLS